MEMEGGTGNGVRFIVRPGDFGTWILVIITSLSIMGTGFWSYFTLTERISSLESRSSAIEARVTILEKTVLDIQSAHRK